MNLRSTHKNSNNLACSLFCLAVALCAPFFMTSCNTNGQDSAAKEVWSSENKLKVATTATMIADMAKIIGGDQVEVIGMVPPGIDPHTYEKTFNDTAVMNTADVLFYLGLHFEGRMQEGFEQRKSKSEQVYAIADSIPQASLLEVDGEIDPHVWGDPEVWAATVDTMVKGLSAADPENAALYQERGANYQQELLELKAWAQTRVAELPESQRVLITSHDAFQYFANAFGFTVRGLQGISTADEAGIKRTNDLIKFIQTNQVSAIFAESATSDKGIQTVAEQAGIEVCTEHLYADSTGELNSIKEHNGESYDIGTFIGMVKHNVNTVVDALK